MARTSRRLKIPGRYRTLFYVSTALLFFTGILWWFFDTRIRIAGEFGENHHPIQKWLLTAHGLLAPLFLVGMGSLYVVHIRPALKEARNQKSGWVLILMVLPLASSGYLLYYAGMDEARSWIAGIHLWVGMSIPLGLLTHVLLGRRTFK